MHFTFKQLRALARTFTRFKVSTSFEPTHSPKMVVLVLVFILTSWVRIDCNAQFDVDIKPTENKIIFAKEGKLIPQVSFATIRAKMDFKSLRQESDELCKTSQVLSERLHHKLKACPPAALPESDICAKEITTKEEHLLQPWKSYIKKRPIGALLDDLKNTCSDNERRLAEIANTFQLNTLPESFNNSNSDELDREKRQSLAAVLLHDGGRLTDLTSPMVWAPPIRSTTTGRSTR